MRSLSDSRSEAAALFKAEVGPSLSKLEAFPTSANTAPASTDEFAPSRVDISASKSSCERASAAFLGAGDVREGLAEFMAAEAKAGPSRTERIKSIAGLEEYKSKKAKEIAEIKLRNKTYAPGNAQKNYEFFISQGIDKDQALNLSMGKARNFDEAFLNLSAKGTVTAKLFDTLARQEGIDPLPQVDIETLEVGETFYVPGAKSLVRIVLKEGKKDLIQTPY